MTPQIWKSAYEKMNKIESLIASYNDAVAREDSLTAMEHLREWSAAYEERMLLERTLKTAITNFAKYLGWRVDPEFDYMEKRIEIYYTIKRRFERITEILHEDDNESYYKNILKAI